MQQYQLALLGEIIGSLFIMVMYADRTATVTVIGVLMGLLALYYIYKVTQKK